MSGLNAGASEWKPSASASAFVPGGGSSLVVTIQSSTAPSTEQNDTAPSTQETTEPSPSEQTTEPSPSEETPAEETTPAPETNDAPEEEESEPEVHTTVMRTASKRKKNKEQKQAVRHDAREHLNIVFIGHVDAGKSTISGQMMMLTNQVDQRTIEKYEKEAKEKNRESWYLAYIMDTNEEERDKGKTVEVGRATFSTAKKRYTLLDAPGHRNYVPNMIGGTAQADVGVLVISARKSEFETGFGGGGQTTEHAVLARTLGISRLIVLVNKMDDQTVKWSQDRYTFIKKKLGPFLKGLGFKVKKHVFFIPVSGFTGANLAKRDAQNCDWYSGPTFMQCLDELQPVKRPVDGPLRVPVLARFKLRGAVCILGKIESGTVTVGDSLTLMPSNKELTCTGILINDEEAEMAQAGENAVLKVKGVAEDDIDTGYVVSDCKNVARRGRRFMAQVAVLQLPDNVVLSPGSTFMLHVHTAQVSCELTKISWILNKKTGKKEKPRQTGAFLRSKMQAGVTIKCATLVAMENFSDVAMLGRFTLRDSVDTIAVGKIQKIADE